MQTVNALPPLLEQNLAAIRELCTKHGVKRLAVFGSAARGTFDPSRSDVDFVVEFFPDAKGFDAYFDLKFALQDLLGRAVDLVELKAVENPYFRRSVEASQQEVYAAA
jgi:predicted nucleotidyltransferase